MVGSKIDNERIKKAIETLEGSGLSVYRPKRKDRLFVKLYIDYLIPILSKISGSALKVFHALASRMNYEDTVVEMTKNEIQKMTGLSEPTVREALDELEELKIISRIGPNIKRKYVLNEIYVKKGK